MNFKEIKDFIYENDKVVDVLESIDCHHIVYHEAGYWTCGNCNGDNNGAIVIYNESTLYMYNYTRQMEFRSGADIIDLVQYNLKVKTNKEVGLGDAMKYLHDLFGLEYKYNSTAQVKKFDPLAIFRKVIHCCNYDNDDYEKINKELDFDYIQGVIHESWIKVGLTKSTIEKFKLGYSYRLKRVIIPIRMWNTGEIIAYNKRTVIPNYDLLGVKKFILTKDYPKSLNIYGLYENFEAINRDKIVILFEAEKSVLRRDSRKDSTCVALQGHRISKEQVAIICGLDINEVVVAMDKDIGLVEVRSLCEKFYLKKKVSYIYDNNNILGDKDSPADANDIDYMKLFNSRIIYDEKEHNLFIEYMNRKVEQ